MKNKTCGECKHYICQMTHCEKHNCFALDDDRCEDFESKVITNGDAIRQMSNGAFAFMMTRLILEGCPISKSKTMYDCKVSNDCTNCLQQWLNAPAESQLNDAIQNVIKDGAKTAIDIHEAAYAPDMNDGTMIESEGKMSKLVCKNCKSIAVEYEDYCGGTSYYRCKTCGQRGDKDKFTQQSVFDRITASPEVLAPYLVYFEEIDEDVPNSCGWTSDIITERYRDRKKAIAATVARLKEVCDE